MTKTIDFLLHDTPYTALDICKAPNIFNYKLDSIKKRIAYIKSTGKGKVSLNTLMSIPVEAVENEIVDGAEP